MPRMRATRSPARDSLSGWTSGIPPPTAPSNARSTPALSAASNRSAPAVDRSSLLAVTTGLPERRASRIELRAGSTPPITSTTISTSGSPMTSSGSSVRRSGSRGTSRGLPGRRTATRRTSSRRPARRSMSSLRSASRRITAEPTTPHPRTPTPTVLMPLHPPAHHDLVFVAVRLLGVTGQPSLLREPESPVQAAGGLVARIDAEGQLLHPRPPGRGEVADAPAIGHGHDVGPVGGPRPAEPPAEATGALPIDDLRPDEPPLPGHGPEHGHHRPVISGLGGADLHALRGGDVGRKTPGGRPG